MSQVPQITPLHPAKTYRYVLLMFIYRYIVTKILMAGIQTKRLHISVPRNGGGTGVLDMALGEGFPTAEQCEKAPLLPQWDDFPSVFLPAENKGFS